MDLNSFKKELFSEEVKGDFEALALSLYKYQVANNKIYQLYVKSLRIDFEQARTLEDIAFLPIELFKTRKIISGDEKWEIVFHSSGTSGENVSKHYVKSIDLYQRSFIRGFELEYGNIDEYIILAILPNYHENPNSSLIYMIDEMIKRSGDSCSGYYLHNDNKLYETIKRSSKKKKKFLVFGVSFALLDSCRLGINKINAENLLLMETGGMKGRRKEMVRSELHNKLMKGFGVNNVHSEYGMTELLSQSYSKGDGLFKSPPWKKILIREINDPLSFVKDGNTGGINIIDLANIHSCAFIATNDLGKKKSDGTFEVLGRFDNSDLRGCSLLVAES